MLPMRMQRLAPTALSTLGSQRGKLECQLQHLEAHLARTEQKGTFAVGRLGIADARCSLGGPEGQEGAEGLLPCEVGHRQAPGQGLAGALGLSCRALPGGGRRSGGHLLAAYDNGRRELGQLEKPSIPCLGKGLLLLRCQLLQGPRWDWRPMWRNFLIWGCPAASAVPSPHGPAIVLH